MKKIIILLMTVMGTLQLNAQDKNFWIFLCFGQSNMAGQAPIEAQDLTVNDRYLSLATTDGADRTMGTWRKAVPPLCRADAHLGPADWFGRTLLEVVPENVRIGIVSVAVEGCPITFFDKDQNQALIAKEERDWMNDILDQYGRDPYKRLLSMAKIAAKDGVIKGILLHQGETDAYNDQWRKTLMKIYRDLQQELHFDSTAVPLLVGEVIRGEYGGICGHANPTINDIANHYPNTHVVSSEGCLPSDDNLHFSSEGYRMLGRHYALRYLEVTCPALAEKCRERLAAAGMDKASGKTSENTSPSFDEVLTSRRSVRSYDATKKISEAEIRELLLATQEAPSWANQQPTKYYVAISEDKLKAVQDMVGSNKERIKDAPVLIVSSFERGKSGFFLGEPANEVGNGWGAYDNGLSNCYLILKARAMGFDTLIMGIRDSEALRSLFDIPEDETVMAVIALGYRAGEPRKPGHKPLDDIVKFY